MNRLTTLQKDFWARIHQTLITHFFLLLELLIKKLVLTLVNLSSDYEGILWLDSHRLIGFGRLQSWRIFGVGFTKVLLSKCHFTTLGISALNTRKSYGRFKLCCSDLMTMDLKNLFTGSQVTKLGLLTQLLESL